MLFSERKLFSKTVKSLDDIEMMIAKNEPLEQVLRLLCL